MNGKMKTEKTINMQIYFYIKLTFENNVFIALNNLSYTFKVKKNISHSIPQYCPLYRVLPGTGKPGFSRREKPGAGFMCQP